MVESVLPLDEEQFEHAIIETSAQDYEFNDGSVRVVTAREDFMATVRSLESNGWKIASSDFAYLADNEIALDERAEEKLQTIIDVLEDDEDVDTVWHNAA